MAHRNAIYEALHSVKLADFVNRAEHVQVLDTNSTVEAAVKFLSEKNILSAPVVDAKTKDCVGIIDMLDIVHYIVRAAPEPSQLHENYFKSLEMFGRVIALETVNYVLNASGRDPYVPIYHENPVTLLVSLFAKGIHRAPVLDANNKVINTTSQSDIVRYLAEHLHMGKAKAMGETPVSKLGLGANTPVVVFHDDSVLKALQTIKEKGVSAVGVVDEQGKLVGNFSASDLKGLYREQLPSLTLSVREYLKKHSPKSLSPISTPKDATLMEVAKMLKENKLHRLWVLDENRKPAGVITLTDLMGLVENHRDE